MAFANKIECESHYLERPRSCAHALALTEPQGYHTGAIKPAPTHLPLRLALSQPVTERPSWTLSSMLARSGMVGMMAFANKIEYELHQLERPRSRAHALAPTRTTGISHRCDQTNCARTLSGRRGYLKRWKQARNVPPVVYIISILADNCTRITTCLAQRHQQEEQQQEYRAGAVKPITPWRRGCLKRWRQTGNVPPFVQIIRKLADNCTRITTRLTQRHR